MTPLQQDLQRKLLLLLHFTETLMEVLPVSRGWMMEPVSAVIMTENRMLLITARLFNQLSQKETQQLNATIEHSLTNKGK